MITGAPQPWQPTPPAAKLVPPPSFLRRTTRWLPTAALCFLSACSIACTLLLVLLPMARVAAPFGLGLVPSFSASAAPPPASVGYLALVLYAAVWILAAASFAATARTAPGHVPQWLYSRDQGDKHYFHNVLQAVERKFDGGIRFCRKSGAFKPDLAHYSRQLGLCILCYQHWDVWTNNAIGFYNHKMYLLSLFYSTLAHALSLALLIPGVSRQWPLASSGNEVESDQLLALVLWEGGEGSVLAFAALSACAAAVLGGGALCWLLFHAYLVARGVTAHTYFRQAGCLRHKPPKRNIAGAPFDFGVRGNFYRTFGKSPLLWLLPTNAGVEGNGIFFDLAVEAETPKAPGEVWGRS